MLLRKFIPVLLLFLVVMTTAVVHAQPGSKLRPLALLDMTSRNSESSDANIESLKHLADVAGIPYFVTDEVSVAVQYNMIVGGSEFNSSSFDSDEIDDLENFVDDGGILLASAVTDEDLYPLFGIDDYTSSYSRYSLKWNWQSGDNALRWIDDKYERTIKLGDSIQYEDAVIKTRSYSRSGASKLAIYGDGSTAVVKNAKGQGYAYALGVAFKDVVMRCQMNRDYFAQRDYSNYFNPGTDVFMLFIKAIYAEYTPYATWKHSAPWNCRYVMMMSHDIDAFQSMDTMHYYAEYEYQNQIRATYFVTTHYFSDDLDGDYYTPNIAKIAYVHGLGQTIASHSVGHFPDFYDTDHIPPGGPGHTRATYHPHYSVASASTIGGSTYGECEVSRDVLEEDLGVNIVSFRAGYLAYPDILPNVLADLGYNYNSSYTATDVLTNFPYFEQENCSFTGNHTNQLEIPLTFDVDYDLDAMTPQNFYDKADIWLDEMEKIAANYGLVLYLIHPTQYYKLTLMDYIYQHLPWGACKMEMGAYGEYWNTRRVIDVSSEVDNNDVLTITIPDGAISLNDKLSLIINNGQSLSGIEVKYASGNPVAFFQSAWENNDLVICFSVNPASVSDNTKLDKSEYVRNYPNPAVNATRFEYGLSQNAQVTLTIYDQSGRIITTLTDENQKAGVHYVDYATASIEPGVYFYTLTTNSGRYSGKMVVVR